MIPISDIKVFKRKYPRTSITIDSWRVYAYKGNTKVFEATKEDLLEQLLKLQNVKHNFA